MAKKPLERGRYTGNATIRVNYPLDKDDLIYLIWRELGHTGSPPVNRKELYDYAKRYWWLTEGDSYTALKSDPKWSAAQTILETIMPDWIDESD